MKMNLQVGRNHLTARGKRHMDGPTPRLVLTEVTLGANKAIRLHDIASGMGMIRMVIHACTALCLVLSAFLCVCVSLCVFVYVCSPSERNVMCLF